MATGDTFQVGGNHLGTARSEQAEINAEEQRSTLEELETAVETRERAVEAREALADERDRTADRREALADERERLADEREQSADRREAIADEREQALNELEGRVDARARALGIPVQTVNERVLETIARGRAMLTASMASLDRSEAAITRSRARNHRNQTAVDREAETTSRMLGRQPGAGDRDAEDSLQERAQQLRTHFVALANELAATEDRLAELHERRPDGGGTVRLSNPALATSAREAAQRLREAAASLAGSDSARTAPFEISGEPADNGAAANGDGEDSSLSFET